MGEEGGPHGSHGLPPGVPTPLEKPSLVTQEKPKESSEGVIPSVEPPTPPTPETPVCTLVKPGTPV